MCRKSFPLNSDGCGASGIIYSYTLELYIIQLSRSLLLATVLYCEARSNLSSKSIAYVQRGCESSTPTWHYSEHHFGLSFSEIHREYLRACRAAPYQHIYPPARRHGLRQSIELPTAMTRSISWLTCTFQDGKYYNTPSAQPTTYQNRGRRCHTGYCR